MKRLIRRGLAPGYDVTIAMSAGAMRESALQTRPRTRITPRTPVTELGIEIGRRLGRRGRLWASHEHVVIVVGGPGTGKTKTLLVHHVIDAPGASLVTSTKPDIVEDTQPVLSGRPSWVLNPEGLGDGRHPSTLFFDPVRGCEAESEAMLRAGYLLSGTSAEGTEDASFWEGNSFDLVRCLLRAAAIGRTPLGGRYTMLDVVRWVLNLEDPTPLEVLDGHSGAWLWAQTLRKLVNAPEKTRESVAMATKLALMFLSDPALARAVCPVEGEQSFDVDRFVTGRGVLYLIGTGRRYGALGPLFAALTGHIFDRARQSAAAQPGGRLDPPLRMVLDEASSICRVPLPEWTSHARGSGISLIISLQAFAQLEAGWGTAGADTIRTNAGVTIVFPGAAVNKQLEDLSGMCGDRSERTRSRSSSGDHHSTRRVPVLSPADIRELPPFTPLVLQRSTPPVLVRTRKSWRRRDYRKAHR